jgi:hypothetical protein
VRVELPYLTVKEAAERLELSIDQFARFIETGKLQIFRIVYPLQFANEVGGGEIDYPGSADAFADFLQEFKISKLGGGSRADWPVSAETRLHPVAINEARLARMHPEAYAVMPEALVELRAPRASTGEGTLDARKRRTLLCIIGALAAEADLDLSQPYKAGEAIAALLDAKGVKVTARAIGDNLKEVPEAMDSRTA